MLYRRSPLHPPKLLLRVAASAGLGTLVGMAACSSGSSSAYSPEGSAPATPSDASDDGSTIVECLGFCGFVVEPDEAGEPDADAGLVTDADAGPVIDASHDDASMESCNPVCGIVVHPDE